MPQWAAITVTPLTDRTIQKETLVKTQRHRTSRRPSIEEWLHTMNDSDRLQVQALLDILGGCKEFGLSISVQGILSINVAKGRGFVTALGILKDGEVQIPWYAADEKAAFRPFAEILSNNIPEAEFYETAKMWRVRIHDRQVRIGELMQARAAIRSAFEALYAALSSPK